MTAFRAAFKAYRMHQVLILPRFARLTIALGLATAVFPAYISQNTPDQSSHTGVSEIAVLKRLILVRGFAPQSHRVKYAISQASRKKNAVHIVRPI